MGSERREMGRGGWGEGRKRVSRHIAGSRHLSNLSASRSDAYPSIWTIPHLPEFDILHVVLQVVHCNLGQGGEEMRFRLRAHRQHDITQQHQLHRQRNQPHCALLHVVAARTEAADTIVLRTGTQTARSLSHATTWSSSALDATSLVCKRAGSIRSQCASAQRCGIERERHCARHIAHVATHNPSRFEGRLSQKITYP